MIDTDKYEGHTPAPWELITNYSEENWDNKWVGSVHLFTTLGISFDVVGVNETDVQLMADAPLLLQRLQYLEKYAPTFQVFAQNEEDMEEEYTQHGSLKECEEYIAVLEDGWVGRIEVIEYYVPTNNPQVKTLEEWRNEE